MTIATMNIMIEKPTAHGFDLRIKCLALWVKFFFFLNFFLDYALCIINLFGVGIRIRNGRHIENF